MQDNPKTYCVREAVLGLELNRPKSWICVALEAYISMLPHPSMTQGDFPRPLD